MDVVQRPLVINVNLFDGKDLLAGLRLHRHPFLGVLQRLEALEVPLVDLRGLKQRVLQASALVRHEQDRSTLCPWMRLELLWNQGLVQRALDQAILRDLPHWSSAQAPMVRGLIN